MSTTNDPTSSNSEKQLSLQELREVIKKIPKVELHRHVEGAIRFSTLKYYYCKDVLGWDETKCLKAVESESNQEPLTWDTVSPSLNKLDQDVIEEYCVAAPIESLQAFLKKFEDTRKLFRDVSFIERMAYENVEDCYHEGTKIVELRYSPSYIRDTYRTMSLDDIHDAMMKGIKRAQSKYNIAVGLIGILDRSYKAEDVDKDLDFIINNKKDFIGVDLANDELSNPVCLFQNIFERAKKAGLKVTIHSGEVGHISAPKWVYDSVDLCGASRIGHGIQVIEDSKGDIIKSMIDRGIVFEVCPSSNYLLNGTKSLETHPIRTMKDKGLLVTVNTDDPGLFLTNMNKEIELLVTHMGFTIKEIEEMMQVAYNASFIPDEIKSKYWKI